MKIPVSQIASVGMNGDLPPQMLPLPAWTDLRNASFREGYIGSAIPAVSLLTPTGEPLFVGAFEGASGVLWAYGTKTAVYAFDSSSLADVTRISGAYTGGEFDFWQGGMFNGFGILNNGADVPQVWNPITKTDKLIDMTNWPVGATARVVRGFKEFLVALDITKSGVRDSRLVKWSHSADPLTLPSSWNETDASKDAGEQSLARGQDKLVDCMDLGDVNVIYSELQTWAMSYVGGQSVFGFRNVFPSSGMLAQGCVRQFGASHFVVTQDDIVIHNLSSINSVADASMRRWFFSHLDSRNYPLTRVVKLTGHRELWICFSTSGSVLDTALVWNWRYNTWTVRDLQNIKSIADSTTLPVSSPDPWTTMDYTWDGETAQEWGSAPSSYRKAEALVLGASTDLSTVAEGNEGEMSVRVERTGIINMSPEEVDDFNYKQLLMVRPVFAAPTGTPITISAGHQDNLNDEVVWDESKTFVVGEDVETSIYATGRYLALRFEWSDYTGEVKFYSYTYEVAPLREEL